MDEALGSVAYDREHGFLGQPGSPLLPEHDYSEETARRIDEAVRQIVRETFERTTAILTRNRPVLDRCAAALLERETLEERDLLELTHDLQAEQPAPDAA